MIDEFRGRYRFLSNFYNKSFYIKDLIYPTAEHAFQSAKTIDPREKNLIRSASTPGQAKRLGRSAKLRSDWEEIKVPTMEHILMCKFWDLDMRILLLATGDQILIEGNTWGDTFWGVCNNKGNNQLGKTLMNVRSYYQGQTLNSSQQ